MYYLGIDVHKDDSYIAVLDDDGDVVEEVRVFDANLDEYAQQYADSKAAIHSSLHMEILLSEQTTVDDIVVWTAELSNPESEKTARQEAGAILG